ncbi:MAG: DUF3887 domain-containing protein [Anaerolineales bacterium]|nr:DUF3887 domain-containing protein [Anaerolineales bacterium]
MTTFTTFARRIAVSLVLAALGLAAACAPAAPGAVTSALTEAEAAAIGENALAALNAGDYAAWSRDWDDVLKSAISEDAFLAYREQVLQTAGRYQETLAVEMAPSPRADSVRWVLTCQFEKAKVRFIMAFPTEGKLMHTVQTEPAN